MKLLKLCVAAVSLLLISCGSFGEGMLAALAGYNPYGYSSYGYSSGGNMDYLLDPNYAAAQATANAAIPAPTGDCSNPTNKCVLTYNNETYTWEVIERANGEVAE